MGSEDFKEVPSQAIGAAPSPTHVTTRRPSQLAFDNNMVISHSKVRVPNRKDGFGPSACVDFAASAAVQVCVTRALAGRSHQWNISSPACMEISLPRLVVQDRFLHRMIGLLAMSEKKLSLVCSGEGIDWGLWELSLYCSKTRNRE